MIVQIRITRESGRIRSQFHYYSQLDLPRKDLMPQRKAKGHLNPRIIADSKHSNRLSP